MNEPPSTIATLAPILTEFDADTERSRQRELGPSEIGNPCDAQLVRKLLGAPRQARDSVPWAPLCGSGVHAYPMAACLRWYNEKIGRQRFIVEERVWTSEVEHGTGDAFDCDNNLVIDWKYVGKGARDEADMGHADVQYQVQVDLYGLGHENAGRTVDWVRLVLLARSHDFWESREWTRAYDRSRAVAAMSRLAVAKGYAGAVQAGTLDIAQVPIDLDGCTWCRYRVPTMASPTWEGCPGGGLGPLPTVGELLNRRKKT